MRFGSGLVCIRRKRHGNAATPESGSCATRATCYYDHVIRTVREYRDCVQYMHLNPVRKCLVRNPEDWPWSSIHSYGGSGPIRLSVDLLALPADEKAPL